MTYQGEEILVGSRALLVDHGMTRGLPASDGGGETSDVYVARSGQVLGTIRLTDVLRPEARKAVAAMREMGLRTVLLSGDTKSATSSVGHDLGVDESEGDLLPDRKQHGSGNCVGKIVRSSWWEMESTMLRLSSRPTSVSPWVLEPMSHGRARMWFSSAATFRNSFTRCMLLAGVIALSCRTSSER